MSFAPGHRLGDFEVIALIGAGGMGEVYRARDRSLNRDVAIKVLPEALARDPERLARFKREAQVLGSLNHPNIAHVYGFAGAVQPDGSTAYFLAMEMVEGEDLAERLTRGAIAVSESVAIIMQIAEGLEEAHERGIIHRDLKPANVKMTPDGKVKILDFGLAKALESAPASAPQVSQSPTLSMMATAAGIILGTAAYMSPEQAKGVPADHRSDIFAFGALVYELLTGRRAFPGETAHDILASVIAREPDWTALPAPINPRLTELVRRCLLKSRRQRWQAIGDVRAELEMIAADPTGAEAARASGPLVVQRLPLWRRALPVAAGAGVATILLGAAAWSMRTAAAALPVTRFEIAGTAATKQSRGSAVAIAPDGGSVAMLGDGQLWLRSLSAFEKRPIEGTDGLAADPAFSPDGQSIAFTEGRSLRTVRLAGGVASTIGELPIAPIGLSWGDTGLLVGLGEAGVARLPAQGGPMETLVTVKPGEWAGQPQMLPGNQTVLFTLATGSPQPDWRTAQVVAQRLGSSERRVIASPGSDARYLRTGHLAFAVDRVWVAAPFDLDSLSMTASPVPMVEGVARAGQSGLLRPGAMLAISDTGTLAYVPGPASTTMAAGAVVLTDRSGHDEPVALPDAPYEAPRVSPDGKHVAVSTDDGREAVVWIYDLSGASAIRRLTFAARNRVPVWSPDSQRVAFQSDRDGDTAIFTERADGSGAAERLTRADAATAHVPESWSSDGRYLSFSVVSDKGTELWMYDFSERQARPFGDVRGTGPANSAFSPDARWIAYTARGEIGNAVVFAQPVPATGARYQVSAMKDTGHHPFWAPSGKELFYFGLTGGSLVAVPITLGSSATVGTPVRVAGSHASNTTAQSPRNYDVTPDGLRFVRTRNDAALANQTFTVVRVVLNWTEELKQRVPVK